MPATFEEKGNALAEQKLSESEERFRILALSTFEGVIFHNKDTILDANEQMTQMFGYGLGELVGRKIFDLVSPEYHDTISGYFKSEQNKPYEAIGLKKDGSKFFVELMCKFKKVSFQNKKVQVSVIRDITAYKLSEKELKEKNLFFTQLLKSQPIILYTSKAEDDFKTLFISENVLNLTGIVSDKFVSNPKLWMNLIHDDDLPVVLDDLKKLSRTIHCNHEYKFKINDGSYKWFYDQFSLLKNSDGTKYIVGARVDITERKIAEEQVRNSLDEKETLLKEIHHRVKNNLQIISSLLKLQSAFIKDKEIFDMFRDTQNRVMSMALIHRLLYQSKSLSKVNIEVYLEKLIFHLFKVYGFESRGIALVINANHIDLSIDTAIPCGLLISEIISNSLKYAFPNFKQGEINIDLNVENNNYKLIICDNGVGIPQNLDLNKTDSLGFQLINTLVEQLNGKIDLNLDDGTKYTITFSELNYKKRM